MKSISTSANIESGAGPEVTGGRCYVDLPQVIDVLREQIEFLFFHTGPACRPGCPECTRLEQVKRCLLQPFC